MPTLVHARPVSLFQQGPRGVDLFYWFFGALAVQRRPALKLEAWRQHLSAVLLQHQTKDGAWPAEGAWGVGYGQSYATSMAMLAIAEPPRPTALREGPVKSR